ncbi:MAG: nucleotide exchange factor GrpE [Acidobacteria bacterium]|nr:nucleotide exchange factor GrpE [Acidobacteriota bacterium]
MTDTLDDPQAYESAADNAPTTPDETTAETLRRERDDAVDRTLRLTAEFDNYRKRIDRERRDLADHLASELLTEFLPVLDDLERALAATPEHGDPALASHRLGLELIHRQFTEVLRRRNVVEIDTRGVDFDPNRHQAVGQDVSPDHREGEVLEEMRRGYTIGDRLLRPSIVRVATRG